MKNYKRIVIVGAVILSAAIAWWAARVWMDQPMMFSDWRTMLFPAIAVILFGAVSGLALILLDRWSERIAALLGAWASFGLFWSGNVYYVSALFVFALFWFIALQYIRNDIADRRQVRVKVTLAHGMKYVLFAAFLMVSLGFYYTPHAQQAGLTEISQGAQMQLRQGLSVNVDQIIRTWLKPIAKWVPPIFALALFLVLWSLNFILREPAVWLGAGIFWVLRKIGFVKIGKKQIESEIIEL
jgi:hypothetical protein